MDKAEDIRTSSFRVLHETPGHCTYGVWINGAKCGDLTVRVSEHIAFEAMLLRGGFTHPARIRRHKIGPGECRTCDNNRDENNEFHPPHDASDRCESGRHPHCSCDTCF